MVTPGGNVSVVADDMYFPNGSVITPDEGTLIVVDSLSSRLTAFDIKPDGMISRRRIWAQLGKEPADRVVPDGICLFAENAIWVADAFHNEVIKVIEGGEITRRIKVSARAFVCMLGGEDRCTLFIMTADTSKPDEAKAKKSGRIEMANVQVPGAGLP